MAIINKEEIREYYHEYLLDIHKNWNKPGNKTDTASQRVTDTFYLWKNGNRIDFWKYLSGEKKIIEAYEIIRRLLEASNATSRRQDDYCIFLDDFKNYLFKNWGGITEIIDENTIKVKYLSEKEKIKPLDDTHTEEEKIIHADNMNMDELKKVALSQRKDKPYVWTSTVIQRKRDLYIAEYTRRRADGICQLCWEKAPFNRPDGEPYLEAHHIVWLSQGGEDSIENCVALCPNCHKKMHIVNNSDDIKKLTNLNKRQIN